jgi:hypothetical protein
LLIEINADGGEAANMPVSLPNCRRIGSSGVGEKTFS